MRVITSIVVLSYFNSYSNDQMIYVQIFYDLFITPFCTLPFLKIPDGKLSGVILRVSLG